MNSVLSLLIISIFSIIVYGWSLNLFGKHRDKPKKLYIKYDESLDRGNDRDDGEVGGDEGPKYDKDGNIILKCSENPCKNNSICSDDKDYGHTCECKPGYSGRDCGFKDSESKGVGVNLLDNIDSLIPPVIQELKAMFPSEKNNWNSYL